MRLIHPCRLSAFVEPTAGRIMPQVWRMEREHLDSSSPSVFENYEQMESRCGGDWITICNREPTPRADETGVIQ